MLVDWVRHTPFDNDLGNMGLHNRYATVAAALPSQYPTTRVPTPAGNLISNGGFENPNVRPFPTVVEGYTDSPASWALTGDAQIVEGVSTSSSGTHAMRVSGGDASASQTIDSIYHNFTLNFGADIHVTGATAEVVFEYLNWGGTVLGTPQVIPIQINSGYARFTHTTNAAPIGTQRVRVTLRTRPGSTAFFDDLTMRMATPLTLPNPLPPPTNLRPGL